MTKDELSPEQLALRARIRERLGAAGWDDDAWEELFESGVSVDPEISADRDNRTAHLRLGCFFIDGRVRLEIESLDRERTLMFILHPRRSMEDLVAAVVAVQDTLSTATYAAWIKAVALPLCRQVALETPEGAVRLS